MKAVRIILLILLVVFAVIQFIPPGIPENETENAGSFAYSELSTEPILKQFRVSCFDCHSHQTDFPWYSRIAPVSWWLGSHIEEGISHLNFSTWNEYSKRELLGLIDDIVETTEKGEMPLRSYLIVHRDARLSTENISAIREWGETASEKLLE